MSLFAQNFITLKKAARPCVLVNALMLFPAISIAFTLPRGARSLDPSTTLRMTHKWSLFPQNLITKKSDQHPRSGEHTNAFLFLMVCDARNIFVIRTLRCGTSCVTRESGLRKSCDSYSFPPTFFLDCHERLAN